MRFDQPISWLRGVGVGVWGLRFDYMLFKVTKGEKGNVGILKQ
jgi:hypothetical protein